MQYNLTRTQIRLLLDKDDQFRADMTEVLANLPKQQVSILDTLRLEIRTFFPYFNTTEKISAIKHARERASNWKVLSDAFQKAGYDIYTPGYGDSPKPTLGLAAAKRFVESC